MIPGSGKFPGYIYIYKIQYYSTIQRNELMSFGEMWINLDTVIQSEVSQKEKQILYINAYMWNLEKW